MDLIGFTNKKELIIDFGNGVGRSSLPSCFSSIFDLTLINQYNLDKLNFECGAEFVQKDFKFAANYPMNGILCSSFDGDADRIIYSYSENGKYNLLDGGKICALYCLTIRKLYDEIQADEEFSTFSDEINLKIIQTAYTNGATIKYFKEVLGLEVFLTPTGFKFLEKEAKKCDLGIAFEPNGHGTIFYKQELLEKLVTKALSCKNEKTMKSLNILVYFLMLGNQATGDAIMNTLAIEFCLRYLDFSPNKWRDIYSDFDSRTSKIIVNDKSSIKTTWDEQAIVQPQGLQEEFDKIIKAYSESNSRAFVRPSGTENILRLYVESSDEKAIEEIENKIRIVIEEFKI